MANPDGFTPALEAICSDRCADVGDPPRWRLPELVEPCEHNTPCDECLADAARREGALTELARDDAALIMERS